MNHTSHNLSWCLLITLGLACGRSDGRRLGVVVRDSAGIQIVENAAPLWQQGEEWHLSPTPVVDIGGSQTEWDQLYQVRHATRLSDGQIVVANSGTFELRYYDKSGALRVSAGGEGGGPGEFEDLDWIGRTVGDSVLAFDRRNVRMSVFDPEGGYAGSFALEPFRGHPPSRNLAPVGSFRDGSLLVPVWLAGDAPPGAVTFRQWSTFVRHSVQETLVDSIATFPTSEHYPQLTGNSVTNWEIAFGRIGTVRVSDDHLFFGDGTSFEIRVFDIGGNLKRVIRSWQPRTPVTEADKRQIWEDDVSDHAEFYRAEINRMYADMPFPAEMPAFVRFEIDPSGGLWVELYRRPGDERPRWVVFDRDGQELGVTEMPERFEVLEIGDDYVLGKWEDADDVEHVQMYELEKPAR